MTIQTDHAPARQPTTGSSLFRGGGGMGAVCSPSGGAAPSIGCPDEWSAGLRAAAALVLAAPTPMVLLWGADATQIYNEAYCALMGAKHPTVFGASVKDSWPEGWHLDWDQYTKALSGESVVV